MKNENNIIHLADYIHKQEDIKTIEDSHRLQNLATPSAHIFKRMIALGIDLLIIGLIRSAFHVAYAVFINEVMTPVSFAKKAELAMGSPGLNLVTFILIYTTYFFYTTFILNGKTIGKITMKLTVINEDYLSDRDHNEQDLSLDASVKRAVGYLFCFLSFGIFFIFNFSSEDKRGLPDYLSGSRTVSDEWLAQFKDFKNHEAQHILIDIQDLEQKEAA